MSPSDRQSRLWLAGSRLKRAIRFATYDWTRELPLSLRVITMIGMGVQGYAIWAALSRSLIWPINRHLFRYTPGNRFATAAFIVLDRDSGELVYVNAGHNPPIVWRAGQTNLLEPTGTALGWFDDTSYDAGRMTIPPDGGLLIYTDGLPDSIPGNSPEDSLYRALDNDLARTMSNLKALVDPRFNEDDVTVLLVKRTAASGVRLTAGPR